MPPRRAKPTHLSKRKGRSLKFVKRVYDVAERLGTPLLGWQRDVVDVLARFEKGIPAYPDALISVNRQQGKSILAKVWVTAWAEEFPGSVIGYMAQTGSDARKRLAELVQTMHDAEGYDTSGMNFRKGIGSELIEWPNGSTLFVSAPTPTALHGTSIDLMVADETWALPEHILGGIVPARAARPASQMLLVSTAGIIGESEVMERFRKMALEPDSEIGIAEWSCPDTLDPFDSKAWPKFMPAFHEPWFSAAGVRRAMRANTAHDFRRYFGNQWVEVLEELIPADWWEQATNETLTPPVGKVALAFDVNTDPAGASIAGAFPYGEDKWHMDLVEYQRGESVMWLVDRMRHHIQRYKPTVVISAGNSPVRGIAAEISNYCAEMGVPYKSASVADMGAAAVLMMDGLRNGSLTHDSGPAFDAAAVKSRAKPAGDMWVFDRSKSLVDVSPMVATTLAVFAGREYADAGKVFIY